MTDIWQDVIHLKAERDDLQLQVYAIGDEMAELVTAYDCAVTQNLTEQTWLRMELQRTATEAEEDKEFWRNESLKWAEAFGTQRQLNERNARVMIRLNGDKGFWRVLAIANFIGLILALVVLWPR